MATAGGENLVGGQGEARPRTVAGAAAPGGGLLLGHDLDAGDDVWLPEEARLRGVTVVGKTGTGKSRLLERLLLADLHHGTPAVVIDPHGQLAERVLALAPPQAADRLLLLEPWPDRPWRLNLLACPDPTNDTAVDRTVDHTVEVFKKLFDRSADYQPRLERDLDAAVRTVIPNHGTLLDVLRLFIDDGLRERYRAAVADPAVDEYWDYFARLGRDAERARQVEATVNRLYRLLAPRLIRRIVDTTTTTVPFEAVLGGDQMLLLSIPAGDLTGQRCDFLGALFLAALTDRIFARQAAVGEPARLHLYLDEYARFATPMTAELFAEGRKYGVGLTVAHQTLAQIADAANRAAERQVGALVCFQLTGPDAEELAGEFDTTPTRTKTTLRQRTRPQYKEWDEEVWDPPEAKAEHAAVEAQLARLRDTVGAALARRKASYHMLEYAYGWTGTFDELLAGTLDPVKTHKPFNPKYLSVRVQPGQTIGGLRKLGQPDFWDPEYPEQLRSSPCEGYRLAPGGPLGGPYRQLRSLLAAELDDYAWGPSDSLRRYVDGKVELLGLLKESLADVAADLQRQVTAMLDPQYREAIFWFYPYKLELVQIIHHWNLPEETVKKLAAEEAWLARTRPGLGQERPVRMFATARHLIDGGEVKYERDDKQWPSLGWWQLTAFPQAVAWLKGWIRDAQRDIAALHVEYNLKRTWLYGRMTTLEHTHLKQVHHKEYLGEIPEQRETTLSYHQSTRSRSIRGMGAPYQTIREQWYDPVEELDQTHADRRLELANVLTQLPPLTVYCRTPTGQHRVALPRMSETALDKARIERIRQESRTRFGRPPDKTAPPVAPGADDSAPKRWIRRNLDEDED